MGHDEELDSVVRSMQMKAEKPKTCHVILESGCGQSKTMSQPNRVPGGLYGALGSSSG